MKIIGNKKIVKLLDRSIKNDNVAQSYIFSGPEGVGKFTLAKEFAMDLLGRKKDVIDPDLIIIKPETQEENDLIKKEKIKIEKIRDFQRKAALSASNGNYRVAIIDDAQEMNVSAQNALLKTLEEPSDNLIIILVVQDEKKVLPTLISRCQIIKLSLVSDLELEKEIDQKIANKKEILFWSLGRPGFMKKMIKDKKEVEFNKNSLEELKKLFGSNVSEKFSLAQKMSKDLNITLKNLNIWTIIARQSLLGSEKLIKISSEKALIMIDEISKSMRILKDTNSNRRLVLEDLFLAF